MSFGIEGSFRRDILGLLVTHYASPHTKFLTVPYFARPDERTTYIATIEKPDTNIHVHALFRMTQEQKARFTDIAPGIWKKLVEAGNLDIQPVHHTEGAARYVTKALRPETSDRLLAPPHKEKKLNIAA
jgi:hypothetical protein